MIIPLFGHDDIRARLDDSARRGGFPASLLLQGPRGIGKQRLALWLGQRLLCAVESAPCGSCQGCRFAQELTHPDLHWYFPRPRLKDTDPELEDIRSDYAEAIAERADEQGLYPAPPGSDGIFVATVRAIVQQAVMSPAIGPRRVFIIGDAERMVPQEGTEFAANAFLKLLEEPPADTNLILTSSEPGALLPTVRSRVVTVRVPPVDDRHVREFLAHDAVSARLAKEDGLPDRTDERVAFAAGAPGRLLGAESWQRAMEGARRILEAAAGKPAAAYETAWTQSSAKARGSFADTLDALSQALHERAETSVHRGAERAALGATRAIEAVEVAKERVASNVSPQLITVNLIRELARLIS
jgi:DNA polymerase-3 subunit delta'